MPSVSSITVRSLSPEMENEASLAHCAEPRGRRAGVAGAGKLSGIKESPMRSLRCSRIPEGLRPVRLNFVMLFCGHEKNKEIFVLVPEAYSTDVEVLRQVKYTF